LQGNAAFKEQQWDKAVTHYTGAIELNGTNATYYCNRAAACLKLGWYEVFPVCQQVSSHLNHFPVIAVLTC